MTELSLEEKVTALTELSGTGYYALAVRYNTRDRHWYCVVDRVSLAYNGSIGSVIGNGATPQEAVEDYWEKATNLPPDRLLSVYDGKDRHDCFLWNGSRWQKAEPDGR